MSHGTKKGSTVPTSNNRPANTGVMMAARMEAYAGPLPRPEELEKFGKIDASFPERIFRMAEQEAAHRHTLENKIVGGSLDIARRGQAFAFIVALVGIGVAVGMAYLGGAWAGAVVAGGSLATIVTAFVTGGRRNTSTPVRHQPQPSDAENTESPGPDR